MSSSRVGVAVGRLVAYSKVVLRSYGAGIKLLFMSARDGRLEKQSRLRRPPPTGEDDRLAREGADEDVGQLQALSELECPLEWCHAGVNAPGQHVHAAELRERARERGIWITLVERGDGLLEAGGCLVQASLGKVDVREGNAGPRSRIHFARVFEQRDRPLEALPCLGRPVRIGCEPSALQQQPRLVDGIVGQSRGLLEVPLTFLGGAEGSRPLTCSRQHLSCLGADLAGIVRLRPGLDGGEVVGSEHLGDVVFVSEDVLQVGRGGQVPCLPLALGERLVGDVADEVL